MPGLAGTIRGKLLPLPVLLEEAFNSLWGDADECLQNGSW